MSGNQRATFTCTALVGTNKAGIIKPDKDGYYPMVLGALDFYNSAGDFYPFESAKDLFKESSSLMRRIANGSCRAEYGHPKKTPGMSDREFLSRILAIHEDRVCAHFKEVSIDYTSVKDKNGKPVIAVIGKVKPCGPYGPALKESLENKDENVCFSVRSLTRDNWNGSGYDKHIQQIICWDYVNEPGISVANKYQSPALESANDSLITFTAAHFGSIREMQQKHVSMENVVIDVEEIMANFGWTKPKDVKPPSMKW